MIEDISDYIDDLWLP